MIGILPGRLATRQRLLVGAMIVAGTSVLNLIGVEIGPLGSPWPVALLWAACGWSGLGPNVSTAALLFVLGLWVDILTGAPLGTWALIGLLTHAITMALSHFLGLGNLGRIGSVLVSALTMSVIIIGFGFSRGGQFDFFSTLLPMTTSVILYQFVGKFFELSEDEA